MTNMFNRMCCKTLINLFNRQASVHVPGAEPMKLLGDEQVNDNEFVLASRHVTQVEEPWKMPDKATGTASCYLFRECDVVLGKKWRVLHSRQIAAM